MKVGQNNICSAFNFISKIIIICQNLKINYIPNEKEPIENWLKPQGRFRHLFNEKNKEIIDEIQEYVDKRWEKILELAGNK